MFSRMTLRLYYLRFLFFSTHVVVVVRGASDWFSPIRDFRCPSSLIVVVIVAYFYSTCKLGSSDDVSTGPLLSLPEPFFHVCTKSNDLCPYFILFDFDPSYLTSRGRVAMLVHL